MTDDLSIPAFLIATGPGTPHQVTHHRVAEAPARPPGYGASCWEEMQKPTELNAQVELRAAVKQYEDEKRFAAFQQYCHEHPELVAMDRKAKQDAERRIARLGVPPANRRRR